VLAANFRVAGGPFGFMAGDGSRPRLFLGILKSFRIGQAVPGKPSVRISYDRDSQSAEGAAFPAAAEKRA
jgi:hypothetical protein